MLLQAQTDKGVTADGEGYLAYAKHDSVSPSQHRRHSSMVSFAQQADTANQLVSPVQGASEYIPSTANAGGPSRTSNGC